MEPRTEWAFLIQKVGRDVKSAKFITFFKFFLCVPFTSVFNGLTRVLYDGALCACSVVSLDST